MSVKTKQKLRESYEKFGDVEIPVLDFDNIIAGHQRHSVKMATGFGDELADVRKPNRKLTEQEYKEYNIISNALKGDFVGEMLAEHFAEVVELEDYGIQLDAIAKIHEKEATVDSKPELPIVQKMSEKYTAFVILWQSAKTEENAWLDKNSVINEHLKPFPKTDFERWGDKNWLTDVSKSWFNKEGLNLDVQIQEMNHLYELEITIDDVLEFVRTYRRNAYSSPAAQKVKALENRFKELTSFALKTTTQST
ncbi:hypothetical protein U1Q18_052311 [Sarracenia purpurea var. burkii]